MKISIYENAYQSQKSESIEFNEYLNGIRTGKWQDTVLNFRAKRQKKELNPAVTVSGFFQDKRNAANLTEHSGILCIDCDAKENPEILEKRSELGTDNNVYAFHTSISGYGLAVYFKIKKNKHTDSFLAIEKYLADNYHIISDPSCKDVSRLRFVSYDPDLYINEKAKVWDSFLAKKDLQPFNFNPIFTDSDIDFVLQQINNKGIDLTTSYADWLKIGFAFVSEYGERGREKFHIVSKNHPEYNANKTDKKYDSLLKSGSSKFTIATFLWCAKQAGIKIKTENTKKIEIITNLRKKSIGKSGGMKDEETAKKDAIKYLTEVENIDKKHVEEVVEKVMIQTSEDESDKEVSDIERLTEYIKSLPIRNNIVTKTIEYEGKEITDNIENSIFLNAKCLMPKAKFSKDIVLSVLNSDRIKEYNPFLDFFEKYSYMKPKGRIDELIGCISVEHNEYAKFCAEYIRKWLLGIISSMHYIPSVLILVFTGKQMTGKTKFFRGLLPEELFKYYAESKLDAEKDDEILMSKKLIIVDDEFGGKSKQESKKLKELSSKEKITKRKAYGRNAEDYNRIAVLAGTSNDDEIINDPTGNRRIIPVKVHNIDFDIYNSIDKTELFMELYWEWKRIGNGWFMNSSDVEKLNELTQEFYETSLEEDLIRAHFHPAKENDNYSIFMTSTEMMNYCEGFLNKQRLYHKKFGQILKKLGFVKVQKRNLGLGFYVKKITQGL